MAEGVEGGCGGGGGVVVDGGGGGGGNVSWLLNSFNTELSLKRSRRGQRSDEVWECGRLYLTVHCHHYTVTASMSLRYDRQRCRPKPFCCFINCEGQSHESMTHEG